MSIIPFDESANDFISMHRFSHLPFRNEKINGIFIIIGNQKAKIIVAVECSADWHFRSLENFRDGSIGLFAFFECEQFHAHMITIECITQFLLSHIDYRKFFGSGFDASSIILKTQNAREGTDFAEWTKSIASSRGFINLFALIHIIEFDSQCIIFDAIRADIECLCQIIELHHLGGGCF